MVPSTKNILLTAASVSLALTQTATAEEWGGERHHRGNPYVAGDMHNHNTCTDGSVAAGYSIDRAVGTGVAVGVGVGLAVGVGDGVGVGLGVGLGVGVGVGVGDAVGVGVGVGVAAVKVS